MVYTADNASKELFAPIDVNQVLMKQKQRTATNVEKAPKVIEDIKKRNEAKTAAASQRSNSA